MTGRRLFRVVLVNYNSADMIEAVLRTGVFSDDEVIVVDNNSEPERVSGFAAQYGVTVRLSPENEGFAKAVNRAVRQTVSQDRPVLLLNPDVFVDPADLAALDRELIRTGATGTGPVLAYPSGELQVGAAGGPVTLASVAGYFLFGTVIAPRLDGFFLTRSQMRLADRPSAAVTWLCMACLLLAPDAFDVFGPVPENELVYAEDVAWGWAANRAGGVFRLMPDVIVVHDQGSSGAPPTTWLAPLRRLLFRELGPVRGLAAWMCVLVGLRVRTVIRRYRPLRRTCTALQEEPHDT